MDAKSIEKWLIIIGTFAALVTLFLIINPVLNSIVRQEIIIDTLDSSNTDWSFRGYSIAESSAFIYGIVQGMVVGLCLYSLRKSVLYILPILFLIVSVLFNARTGLAIALVALLLVILTAETKSRFKIIFALCISVVAVLLLDFSSFMKENQDSLEWGFSFFEQSAGIFNGKKTDTNTYEVLFQDMLIFPDNVVNLIFGEGVRTVDSDMGYVNQIFSGGLIYLSLLLVLILYMIRRYFSYTKNFFYASFTLAVLLIANTKGDGFLISTGFTRIIALFYTYPIFDFYIKNRKYAS